MDYPRALSPAIVHDYFLNRGVPGLADMIPSASEPVLFVPIFIIHNFRQNLGLRRFFLIIALYVAGITMIFYQLPFWNNIYLKDIMVDFFRNIVLCEFYYKG